MRYYNYDFTRYRKEWETNALNTQTYIDYFMRLKNLALNMFEWKNLPDTVDPRFLELALFDNGYALYFNDETIGDLCLECMVAGRLNVYRIPINRRAYSVNGYQAERTEKDSIIIYNNYLHIPTAMTIQLYARRLYELERSMDVNVKAQKTPIAITCAEEEQTSVKTVYHKMQNNDELIILPRKSTAPFEIGVLDTRAEFSALEMNELKKQIWNEAMTFLGVENGSTEKAERLIQSEVMSNLGGVQAQRYVMLNARREAAEKINAMFGTNIEVDFRQQLATFNIESDSTTANAPLGETYE